MRRVDLAERMLPLCEYHMKVVKTIDIYSAPSAGLCGQAFAASLRDILKDFHILVAQLERQNRLGQLSMQVRVGGRWFVCMNTCACECVRALMA